MVESTVSDPIVVILAIGLLSVAAVLFIIEGVRIVQDLVIRKRSPK